MVWRKIGAKIHIEFPEKKKVLNATKGGNFFPFFKYFSNKNFVWVILGGGYKEIRGCWKTVLEGGRVPT